VVTEALRVRPGRSPVNVSGLATWVIGVLAVVALAAIVVLAGPTWLIAGAIAATIVVFALVLLAPQAVVPAAWVLVVFVGVARKILAGPSGHTANDPLIAAPYALLVPLLFARMWWGSRYRGHIWLAVAFAVVVFVSFVVVLLQGDTSFVTIRAAVEQIVAPLCAVVLVHPSMRGSIRATLIAVRISALVAAVYGIYQYVSPPRWDLRFITNVVVDQGVNAFGKAEPGQFRLFGPTQAPLAFSIVLSLGIVCWAFWEGRLSTRLVAIAVMAVPLLLTSVRTSVFALAVTLPVVALVHYRRRAVVPLVVIIAALAAIPTILSVIAPDLVNRFSVATLGSDTSLNSRVRLLNSGWSSILGFGGGPGASDRGSRVTDNGYLAAFIDFGTLGGVLLILLLLAALYAAVQYALRSGSATRGLPLAIVLVYVLAEASAPVVQGQSGLIFWVVLALLGVDVVRHRGGRDVGDAEHGLPHWQAAGHDAAPAALSR
jgi:hypothetical protein